MYQKPSQVLNALSQQAKIMTQDKPLMIQRELRAGKTPYELVARYDLEMRKHTLIPSLMAFKYSIDSPIHEPFVQQCRGVILDEADNWNIVARPFDKFFNLGDGRAAQIDWKFARIFEKLDGSLLYLYNYKRIWYVAATGSPDASGMVNGFDVTFAELFWQVFFEKGYRLPADEDRDWTFMFELMTPYNRVVVKHKEDRLVLLGARHNESGLDVPIHILDRMGFDIVERLPWKPVNELLNFDQIDPLTTEGYVVTDHVGNRIKVKHPGYVALHQLKGSFSPRMILEVVRNGDFSELVIAFPEWKEELTTVRDSYETLVKRAENVWASTRYAENKKDFARKVMHLPFSGVLFALWDKRIINPREGFRDTRIDHLMEMLEKQAAVA